MARDFWNYVYKYTYTVNIQKTQYTLRQLVSLSRQTLLSARSFLQSLLYSSFGISSGWCFKLPIGSMAVFQNFWYLPDAWVLGFYRITLHLSELHWSIICFPDFLTSIRTSLEYFMFTRFPYIYHIISLNHIKYA